MRIGRALGCLDASRPLEPPACYLARPATRKAGDAQGACCSGNACGQDGYRALEGGKMTVVGVPAYPAVKPLAALPLATNAAPLVDGKGSH